MNPIWMRLRRLTVVAAAISVAAAVVGLGAAGQAAARPAPGVRGYQATVVRTAYGIPHITARDFGSLGYGYGYALASDDLCTMADSYLTVEGLRSRYLGPGGSAPVTQVSNLDSDLFWQWVIDRRVVPWLLSVRTGPGAVGRAEAMAGQMVTVQALGADGRLTPVRRTLWSSRYGPMISEFKGMSLPWTSTSAFTLADANAGNFRILNSYLATDEASSVQAELAILGKYEGLPGQNTIAADAAGNVLYSSVMPIPDVTDAEAEECDTATGKVTFQQAGLPVLDGSRPPCAWGTDPDSAAPGIFGPREEPSLIRRDFTENSNSSYWLANPASPLTGYPRIIGDTGARFGTSPREAEYGLRTRSALSMTMRRVDGTDGFGPPGFTLAGLENLMYSDIQYGATLVKPQLVAMCRAFPHGRAPTGTGHTIAVGDSCRVLAAWNDTENPGSRGLSCSATSGRTRWPFPTAHGCTRTSRPDR